MMLPRDVDCPHCGARIDFGCSSPCGFLKREHKARWKAIGIDKPTQKEIDDAEFDGMKRDAEFRSEYFKALWPKPIAKN